MRFERWKLSESAPFSGVRLFEAVIFGGGSNPPLLPCEASPRPRPTQNSHSRTTSVIARSALADCHPPATRQSPLAKCPLQPAIKKPPVILSRVFCDEESPKPIVRKFCHAHFLCFYSATHCHDFCQNSPRMFLEQLEFSASVLAF